MKHIKLKLVTVFTGILFSCIAFALDLQQAKEKGLVGELASGYLGSPLSSPSADVITLIKDINAKRKAEYIKISTEVGKPLETIELLAGKKAITKTQPGHYIKLEGQAWQKK